MSEAESRDRQTPHHQHCAACKKSVKALLAPLYGRVEPNYQISLGVKPEEYRGHEYSAALAEILAALQAHRGFENFVRAPGLPPVDFFLPGPGFIVEFDEAQHFTLPRKIALERYPPDLKLGFSAARWIDLCTKIHARDDDPPFRDEQRAWYDTLRDFAPAFADLKPTVRLYAGAARWCELNPEKRADIVTFRRLIEEPGIRQGD